MAFKKKNAMSRKAYKANKKTNFLPHDKAKPEKKFLDVAHSGTATTTGYINPCNGVGGGTSASQRIGNRINMKSIEYKLRVLDNTTPIDNIIRIMLVYDKDVEGNTLPVVVGASNTQSILDNTVGTASTHPLNLQNKDRYVVLSDKIYDWQHTSTETSGVVNVPVALMKHYNKWKSITTYAQFNSANAGIGGLNSGAIYLIVLSEFAAGAGANPFVDGVTRVRYTDE